MIPRLLPDGFAQSAVNAKLEDGSLSPLRGSRLAKTFDSDTDAIYRHKGEWLRFRGTINAAPGPIASDRLYYTKPEGRPKMYVNGVTYNLALPRPAKALQVRIPKYLDTVRLKKESGDYILAEDGDILAGGLDPQEDDPNLNVTIVYTYTFVSIFDEESEPAPPSDEVLWSPNNTVIITNFEQLDDRFYDRIDRIRVYRSQTSASGETDFYFVKEMDAQGRRTWKDSPHKNKLGEPIQSLDYNAPPDNLDGLVAMPGGMMAAFVGKQVYFCEPYVPHAWPEKYILTVDVKIVGLVAFGSSLAVLTEGTPYLLTGSAPENMTMQRIEVNFPCVSAAGIVDMGFTAAYPTGDGLVVVSPTGAALVTRALFTRDQWQELSPETFVAGQFNGRYIATYGPSKSRSSLIFDLTNQQPFVVRTDSAFDDFFYEIKTGRLFGLVDKRKVRQFDDPTKDPLNYTWRSKEFVFTNPRNFGAYLIESANLGDEGHAVGAVDNLVMKVYADGAHVATVSTVNRVGRLPAGFRASVWEVSLEGRRPVAAVTIAMSPSEIGMGAMA